jgi:hypothetical protein
MANRIKTMISDILMPSGNPLRDCAFKEIQPMGPFYELLLTKGKA